MKITVAQGDIVSTKADVLIVGHLQDGGKRLGGALQSIDDALNGEISAAIVAGEFEGKPNTHMTVRSAGRLAAKHVVVVGEGKRRELTPELVRQAAGLGVKIAKSLKAESIATVAMGAGKGEQDARATSQAVVEAALLANYSFDGWKKKDEENPKTELKTVQLMEVESKKMRRVEAGAELGEVFARAAMETRDLVNEVPSEMSPEALKKAAEAIAKRSGRVTIKVFNKKEARQMGMNAFLAVASGSETEPYFIHLTYKPKKKAKKSVALVGKGITFDSGGLSLKPSEGMTTMKCDMAGAATVLGVFSALEALEPAVEVHGIIATCENMPSGSAYRPGDVVRAMNGTSIEVLNTDAEGRVTMADSLSYASELRPNAIIDLATLTGACVVALGEEIVGVMTDSEKLAERVLDAADETGEEFWELPLFKGYDKLINSKIADVQNIGQNRWGGALTAGLFLKRFVDPEIPWMHLDIAGPAFAERNYLSYVPYGGSGAAVRTLLQVLKNFR